MIPTWEQPERWQDPSALEAYFVLFGAVGISDGVLQQLVADEVNDLVWSMAEPSSYRIAQICLMAASQERAEGVFGRLLWTEGTLRINIGGEEVIEIVSSGVPVSPEVLARMSKAISDVEARDEFVMMAGLEDVAQVLLCLLRLISIVSADTDDRLHEFCLLRRGRWFVSIEHRGGLWQVREGVPDFSDEGPPMTFRAETPRTAVQGFLECVEEAAADQDPDHGQFYQDFLDALGSQLRAEVDAASAHPSLKF